MAPRGNRRATVVTRTAFGTATLRPDPARPQGWELLMDGVPQSYVDLADPTRLAFEYVRRLGSVVRAVRAPRVPLRVLHLGGGGLTVARLVSATRPGSAQRVVDRDAGLMELVTRALPPPEPLEITIGDARDALEAEPPGSWDLIVSDVFDGARMPARVAALPFARAAARALARGGLFAVNLTDMPPLAYSRVQVATLTAAFADVCLIAGVSMFRGRRAGNVVLVAGEGVPVDALVADAARDPVPARVLQGVDLSVFAAGARPRLDASA